MSKPQKTLTFWSKYDQELPEGARYALMGIFIPLAALDLRKLSAFVPGGPKGPWKPNSHFDPAAPQVRYELLNPAFYGQSPGVILI